MAKTATKTTANDKVKEQIENTRKLMAELETKMSEIERQSNDSPNNWGYVGDMDLIEQRLSQIVNNQ